MIQEKIEIKDIGIVNFVVSTKAKSMRISVKPFEGVVVTLPKGMSQKKALFFLEEKKKWVIKHLKEFQEKEKGVTVFDENTIFSTKYSSLKISRSSKKGVSGRVGNGIISVDINQELDVYTKEIQDFIRKVIEEALREEAKYYLTKRTKELAEFYGFSYKKVSIRNTKTRWGSCSSENNINYSLHLMRLPTELKDYVILHELAHTKEKNHQPPFWKLLDSVTDGKAKILDKKVKQYSTKIY